MFIFAFFLVGIVLGGLVVVFALQNISVVTVHFFSMQLEGSLALILILATLAGVFIALLTVLPKSVSDYFRYRRLKNQNAQLAEELARQKELTHFARKTAPTHEDIAHIEQGAIDDGSH